MPWSWKQLDDYIFSSLYRDENLDLLLHRLRYERTQFLNDFGSTPEVQQFYMKKYLQRTVFTRASSIRGDVTGSIKDRDDSFDHMLDRWATELRRKVTKRLRALGQDHKLRVRQRPPAPRGVKVIERDLEKYALEPAKFITLYRVSPAFFDFLCKWLRENTQARDRNCSRKDRVMLEEKVAMYLLAMAGMPQAMICERFSRSAPTVVNAIREISAALCPIKSKIMQYRPSGYKLERWLVD